MLAQAEYNESIDRHYQAASLYYNVSVHEEGLQNFVNSVKNILLDKAGPKKQALIATLYKDPRMNLLPEAQIIEKIYNQNLIGPEDEATLNQIVQKPGLKQALSQHNIISLSRIYSNISFKTLADRLGVSIDDALVLCETMIAEQRLNAHLDQIEEIVYFDENHAEVFSQNIENFCNALNEINERISQSNK